jgi:hypothetical protein
VDSWAAVVVCRWFILPDWVSESKYHAWFGLGGFATGGFATPFHLLMLVGRIGVVGTACVRTSCDDSSSAKSYRSLVGCVAKFPLSGVCGLADGGCVDEGLAHTYSVRRGGQWAGTHLGALQRGNCFICSHPLHRKKEFAFVSGWHISERHDGGAAETAGGEGFGSFVLVQDGRSPAGVGAVEGLGHSGPYIYTYVHVF